MQNVSLKSIKWESIKSIFGAIAGKTSVSRAEISTATGLSLMTVGKVTDALLSMGIILQTKENRSSAGRRAGLLRVNPAHYAIVLDLTSRDFSMHLIDMDLRLTENRPSAYNDDFFFEENLSLFLKNVLVYLQTRGDMENCVGIGVSVPGTYAPDPDRVAGERLPGLSSIPLAARVRAYFPEIPLYIDADVNTAASSNVLDIENWQDKQIHYWFVDAGNVSGAVVNRGEILRGAHNAAGSFGKMHIVRGRTLETMLRADNTPDENALLTADAIYNTLMFADPDHVVLECELYHHREDFIDLVRTKLREHYDLPDDSLSLLTGSRCDYRHAHRGLVLKLREMWLSRLILPDNNE